MRQFYRASFVILIVALLLTGCLGSGSGPTYTVAGAIKDPRGDGVPGVILTIEGQSTPWTVTEPSGPEGNWTATGLKGEVTITPSLSGWDFVPAQRTVAKADQQLNFAGVKRNYELIITIEGEGQVLETVLPSPSAEYEYESVVKLEAVPEERWIFLHWEGAVDSLDNPVTLHMDGPKEVTAVFSRPAYVAGEVAVRHLFPLAAEERAGATESMIPSLSRRGKLETPEAPVPQYRENEFIIRFEHYDYENQAKLLEEANYIIKDTIPILNAYLVYLPPRTAAAELSALPGAFSIERNGIVRAAELSIPNDQFYDLQWHYSLIRLPQAWSVVKGDSNIRIAVIDSGVDASHPDLSSRLDLEYAYDFTASGTIEDQKRHGTHVAGTIGAVTDNGGYGAGVMWDVTMLPLKVLDVDGDGDWWHVSQAILYAAGLLDEPYNPNPVQVINMSLGSESDGGVVRDAVREADAEGIIMVASAGNDGRPVVGYPAAYPEVIAVGAVGRIVENDPEGLTEPPLAYYSNWGEHLDLVAPGGGGRTSIENDFVYSTYPRAGGEPFLGLGGTSMACPHVTGVIGLMLSNGIPRSEVKEILFRTGMELHEADPIKVGNGLINAYWAVNDVREIRIMEGRREGQDIFPVAECSISPKGGNYALELVPGEYQIMAWIDVNGNGKLDAGDYYWESEQLALAAEADLELDFTITEFDPRDR